MFRLRLITWDGIVGVISDRCARSQGAVAFWSSGLTSAHSIHASSLIVSTVAQLPGLVCFEEHCKGGSSYQPFLSNLPSYHGHTNSTLPYSTLFYSRKFHSYIHPQGHFHSIHTNENNRREEEEEVVGNTVIVEISEHVRGT